MARSALYAKRQSSLAKANARRQELKRARQQEANDIKRGSKRARLAVETVVQRSPVAKGHAAVQPNTSQSNAVPCTQVKLTQQGVLQFVRTLGWRSGMPWLTAYAAQNPSTLPTFLQLVGLVGLMTALSRAVLREQVMRSGQGKASMLMLQWLECALANGAWLAVMCANWPRKWSPPRRSGAKVGPKPSNRYQEQQQQQLCLAAQARSQGIHRAQHAASSEHACLPVACAGGASDIDVQPEALATPEQHVRRCKRSSPAGSKEGRRPRRQSTSAELASESKELTNEDAECRSLGAIPSSLGDRHAWQPQACTEAGGDRQRAVGTQRQLTADLHSGVRTHEPWRGPHKLSSNGASPKGTDAAGPWAGGSWGHRLQDLVAEMPDGAELPAIEDDLAGPVDLAGQFWQPSMHHMVPTGPRTPREARDLQPWGRGQEPMLQASYQQNSGLTGAFGSEAGVGPADVPHGSEVSGGMLGLRQHTLTGQACATIAGHQYGRSGTPVLYDNHSDAVPGFLAVDMRYWGSGNDRVPVRGSENGHQGRLLHDGPADTLLHDRHGVTPPHWWHEAQQGPQGLQGWQHAVPGAYVLREKPGSWAFPGNRHGAGCQCPECSLHQRASQRQHGAGRWHKHGGHDCSLEAPQLVAAPPEQVPMRGCLGMLDAHSESAHRSYDHHGDHRLHPTHGTQSMPGSVKQRLQRLQQQHGTQTFTAVDSWLQTVTELQPLTQAVGPEATKEPSQGPLQGAGVASGPPSTSACDMLHTSVQPGAGNAATFHDHAWRHAEVQVHGQVVVGHSMDHGHVDIGGSYAAPALQENQNGNLLRLEPRRRPALWENRRRDALQRVPKLLQQKPSLPVLLAKFGSPSKVQVQLATPPQEFLQVVPAAQQPHHQQRGAIARSFDDPHINPHASPASHACRQQSELSDGPVGPLLGSMVPTPGMHVEPRTNLVAAKADTQAHDHRRVSLVTNRSHAAFLQPMSADL